ncbi:MAG: hypothetical protein ACJ77N_12475 [Chloroflexota bacterium]
MGILDELIGGGERRQEYDDFVNKVQQGQHDTIPATEAANRYQEVVPSLPTDQYRDSAAQAFQQLSPEQRTQFAEWLRQQGQQQGLDTSHLDTATTGSQPPDPNVLAQATANVRDQNPSIFDQLLGKGGTGGPLDNPIAKMAVAGIAAMAAQRLMGGRR